MLPRTHAFANTTAAASPAASSAVRKLFGLDFALYDKENADETLNTCAWTTRTPLSGEHQYHRASSNTGNPVVIPIEPIGDQMAEAYLHLHGKACMGVRRSRRDTDASGTIPTDSDSRMARLRRRLLAKRAQRTASKKRREGGHEAEAAGQAASLLAYARERYGASADVVQNLMRPKDAAGAVDESASMFSMATRVTNAGSDVASQTAGSVTGGVPEAAAVPAAAAGAKARGSEGDDEELGEHYAYYDDRWGLKAFDLLTLYMGQMVFSGQCNLILACQYELSFREGKRLGLMEMVGAAPPHLKGVERTKWLVERSQRDVEAWIPIFLPIQDNKSSPIHAFLTDWSPLSLHVLQNEPSAYVRRSNTRTNVVRVADKKPLEKTDLVVGAVVHHRYLCDEELEKIKESAEKGFDMLYKQHHARTFDNKCSALDIRGQHPTTGWHFMVRLKDALRDGDIFNFSDPFGCAPVKSASFKFNDHYWQREMPEMFYRLVQPLERARNMPRYLRHINSWFITQNKHSKNPEGSVNMVRYNKAELNIELTEDMRGLEYEIEVLMENWMLLTYKPNFAMPFYQNAATYRTRK